MTGRVSVELDLRWAAEKDTGDVATLVGVMVAMDEFVEALEEDRSSWLSAVT